MYYENKVNFPSGNNETWIIMGTTAAYKQLFEIHILSKVK